MTNTVLVIGAGAAGMMAAGIAAKNGSKVVVIEKNSRPGRKLMITGKGRCNITNNCSIDEFIESVPTNGRFLYSAINKFTPQDTINFFESNGLSVKFERGNRVFPQSDKAVDVVDTLNRFCKRNKCEIRQGTAKKLIIEDKKIIGVALDNEKIISANKVIMACGGMSYPYTGSTGDGYFLAIQAGHSIIKPLPSLVPLVSSDKWCKSLQGLSLKNVSIKVKKDENIIYQDFGEMLFTHFGLSGPIILSASSHMKNVKNSNYSVVIDLKPALSLEQLDKRLQRDFIKNQNKFISNSLIELLPLRLVPIVLDLLDLKRDTKCNQITKQQRFNLMNILKNLTIKIKEFRPIEEAIITSGGVKTSEISPKTMESKLLDGLYFAGEVIDVDAYTGGFNLQIAFSTGYLAGLSSSGGI